MSTEHPSSEVDWSTVPLHAKLASIAAELTRFPKDQHVTGRGGYAFAGVDSMADKVRAAMAERLVVMYPGQVEVIECTQYIRERINADGQPYETVQWRTVVKVTWAVLSGEESIAVQSVGEALDTSDKSANKAQTAARKYAMIGLFNISTGDEPDPDGARPGDDGEQRTPVPKRPQMPSDDVKHAFREKLRAVNGLAEEGWRTTFAAWLATETRSPKNLVQGWLDKLVLEEEMPSWPDVLDATVTERVYNLMEAKRAKLADEKGGAS